MSSGTLKFGIIGCSRVAKKGVLPALKRSKLTEIEIIGSRSKEKAAEYAEQFDCTSSGSYDDVLKNKNVDVVYISLPVALHEKWTIKAAKAGKHVLCEKPSTSSLASARRMVKACKKRNVRLKEGYMFSYHPQHKRVIDFMKKGVLGGKLTFHGYFGFPFPQKNDPKLSKALGGGSLNDSAGYPIYASRMLFGEEPRSVYCKLKIDKKTGVDTKTTIILNFSGGKSAFISTTFGAYFQSTYSMWGTDARITAKRAYAVPADWKTSILVDKNDKIKETTIKPADHFRLMIKDFCKEIQKGKRSKKNFEKDLLSQAKVLEACRISNRKNKIMTIPR